MGLCRRSQIVSIKASDLRKTIGCDLRAITVIISLVGSGKLHGIGIGTIIAMVVVGGIIAVFNHFTKRKADKINRSGGIGDV